MVVCGTDVKADLYKKVWFPFNMDDVALEVKRSPGSRLQQIPIARASCPFCLARRLTVDAMRHGKIILLAF